MDISKKKKQLVVKNVFLLSIFILIIYSLGFINISNICFDL